MSKRELGRYAPKKTKTRRSPANAGDLAALRHDKLAGDISRPRGNEIMCGEQFCQCGQDPSGSNRVTVVLD